MSKNVLLYGGRKRTKAQLQRLQKIPLEQKVNLSLRWIRKFYDAMNGQVYVSFSGGKDSTVLLHLVRQIDPSVFPVFCDTGVEYPEIVEFVKEFPKTIFLKPKMSFFEVLEKYGYPMVSKEVSQKIHEIRTTKSSKLYSKRMYGDDKGNGKLAEKWKFLVDLDVKVSHKCCDVLKKRPAEQFEEDSGLAPYIGDMASESRLREINWTNNYCNAFNSKRPSSHPLSFWTEQDVWQYIYSRDLKVSDIYQIEKRTGCMYCLFGCQFDDEDGAQRFDRMKETHPKYYAVAEKKGIIDMLDLIRPKG